MYLHDNLWIINPLFQLVNILTIHAYCRVTMKHMHVAHSHWDALIYIKKSPETGSRWTHVYWKYIKKVWYLYYNYTFSIDFIRYGHLSAYLILSYPYIDSLRQIYRHVICTNSYLLVDPNVIYDVPFSRLKLPNNNIVDHNSMLHSKELWDVVRIFMTNDFI